MCATKKHYLFFAKETHQDIRFTNFVQRKNKGSPLLAHSPVTACTNWNCGHKRQERNPRYWEREESTERNSGNESAMKGPTHSQINRKRRWTSSFTSDKIWTLVRFLKVPANFLGPIPLLNQFYPPLLQAAGHPCMALCVGVELRSKSHCEGNSSRATKPQNADVPTQRCQSSG